jgi:hypothetical protein
VLKEIEIRVLGFWVTIICLYGKILFAQTFQGKIICKRIFIEENLLVLVGSNKLEHSW